MTSFLIAALLMLPEPPTQVAANEVQALPAISTELPAAQEVEPSAPAAGMICRRAAVQRAGLVTQSRKVCRTAAQWKAAGAH